MNLTEKEKAVIDLYRKMDDEQKEVAMAIALRAYATSKKRQGGGAKTVPTK